MRSDLLSLRPPHITDPLCAILRRPMITIEKIKIFNNYGRDIDGLARVGRDFEKKLFDNDDWSLIDNLFQDIELINKRLAAQTYIVQTFAKLKDNFDHDSYQLFVSKIECYRDFQKVANILKQIRDFISKDTDTAWAGFDNADKFLLELNQDIEKIENCDYQTLEKVNVEFLPTCTYQELSISNGWSDIYLKLSTDLDKIYERMTERKTATNN
jgi:phosphoenolpyruvate carboxylase